MMKSCAIVICLGVLLGIAAGTFCQRHEVTIDKKLSFPQPESIHPIDPRYPSREKAAADFIEGWLSTALDFISPDSRKQHDVALSSMDFKSARRFERIFWATQIKSGHSRKLALRIYHIDWFGKRSEPTIGLRVFGVLVAFEKDEPHQPIEIDFLVNKVASGYRIASFDLPKDPDGADTREFLRVASSDDSIMDARHIRAIRIFQAAFRSPDKKIIDELSKAIELNCNFGVAYAYRASRRLDIGDKVGAMQDYNKAITLMPKYGPWYVDRGLLYSGMGNECRAIEDFDRCIQLDPSWASAYICRGDVLRSIGDRQGAINDYTQAISKEENYRGYYRRGIIENELGDKVSALNDFNKAIELSAYSPDVFVARAKVRQSIGDKAGAIEDYDRALWLDPTNLQTCHQRENAIRTPGSVLGSVLHLWDQIRSGFTPVLALKGAQKGARKDRL